MFKNLWAVGDRSISGEYRRVMSAGDLNIENSNILKLYSAGDINIKDTYIKKLHAAGDIKAANSSFKYVNTAGDIKLVGEVKADIFITSGNISAEFLSCKVLRNHVKSQSYTKNSNASNGKLSGFFKAFTFENFKDTAIDFDYEFKNIISKCNFSVPGLLKCEKLFSFSQISADEINADFVYIKPSSSSRINIITGSEVVISESFKQNKCFKSLPKSVSFEHYKSILSQPSTIMNVESIEADKIFIEKLNADFISGEEIIIGDLCIIEKVEYSKNIKISPKAIVNEVVKL